MASWTDDSAEVIGMEGSVRFAGDQVSELLVISRSSVKDSGRFPEITELKRLVRDRVAPGRDLGHVDR